MSGAPDEPTEVMPEGDDEPTNILPEDENEPTRILPDHEEETRRLDEPGTAETDILLPSMASGSPEEMRTRRVAEEGPLPPEPPPPPGSEGGAGRDDGRRRGLWMLAGSIVAALLLVGVYLAAGGLDFKPAKAADPCDARPWTNPGNLEETVQQFVLSATDGAACELGVTREELTRALADDQSRADFAEENDLSDEQIESAFRSGLNRAIDDAENADAINPLVASGLRAAVKVMPMDQLINLIQDAEQIFSGTSINDLGGLLDGLIGGLSGDGGSIGDSLPGNLRDSLPKDLTDGLRNQLPDEIQKNIPDSVDQRIQDGIQNLIDPKP